MSLVKANGAGDQSSGFYNGGTSASMRFMRNVGSNTELNRDPSPYELKLLSNELYKQAEAAYAQSQELGQVAQAQPAFTGEDLMAGNYGNYAAENVQETIDNQGMTQIDPQSRMKEKFDAITLKEQNRLGENYSARNTRTAILNAITGRPA